MKIQLSDCPALLNQRTTDVKSVVAGLGKGTVLKQNQRSTDIKSVVAG